MRKVKVLRLDIIAIFVFLNDEGEPVAECQSKPFSMYPGVKSHSFETTIEELEVAVNSDPSSIIKD